MQRTSQLSRRLAASCAILLLPLLASCSTQTQLKSVGKVATPTLIEVPPEPSIVTLTKPKPPGYFQNLYLNYFNSPKIVPTK